MAWETVAEPLWAVASVRPTSGWLQKLMRFYWLAKEKNSSSGLPRL